MARLRHRADDSDEQYDAHYREMQAKIAAGLENDAGVIAAGGIEKDPDDVITVGFSWGAASMVKARVRAIERTTRRRASAAMPMSR